MLTVDILRVPAWELLPVVCWGLWKKTNWYVMTPDLVFISPVHSVKPRGVRWSNNMPADHFLFRVKSKMFLTYLNLPILQTYQKTSLNTLTMWCDTLLWRRPKFRPSLILFTGKTQWHWCEMWIPVINQDPIIVYLGSDKAERLIRPADKHKSNHQ